MSTFDPHSNDAMFAKVLAKLDEHGIMLKDIREAGQQTELEIASLKSWRDNFQGKIAMISIVAGLIASAGINALLSLINRR